MDKIITNLIKAIAIEERNHRAMIWAQGTETVSTAAPLDGDAAAAPPPTTGVMDPTVTNSPLTVAPPQAVMRPTIIETVAPQQTAVMNPTANPMAVSQLTAATLNPPTATSSPPQTAVLNQVSPAGTVAHNNAAAALIQLATANPIVSSPPLMSGSADGPSLSFNAHHSTNVSGSPDFLNPSFPLSPTKAQVGQVIPELSHMYTWQNNDNFNAPVLPQLDSLHSTARQWGYLATPAVDVYRNNLANFSYPPMLTANVLDHSGSLPSTGEQPSHTLAHVSNTTPTGSHGAVPTFVSPFSTAGLANGAATQLVQSPAANLIATANGAATQSAQSRTANLMDTSNGLTLNSVLNTATCTNNITTAAVEGSQMETVTNAGGNKTKKRKSHEEESAQLILPDGSRRRHKPRQMDENFIPSVVGRKGRATKKAKTKE